MKIPVGADGGWLPPSLLARWLFIWADHRAGCSPRGGFHSTGLQNCKDFSSKGVCRVNDEQWLAAMNAVSEVVMNRPRPLREFDQIYMRAGDIVAQALRVVEWARGGNIAFIGDGDGIALTIALLAKEKLAPKVSGRIKVFDFDERIVNSVRRFANRLRLPVEAELYNCLDPFTEHGAFTHFYTAPPFGENNEGNSMVVFARRGFEATGYAGEGMIVAADDPDLDWPSKVLQKIQFYAISRGYCVARMEPRLHGYHLPEADQLRSSNLVFRSVPGAARVHADDAIDEAKLTNFYGRSKEPRVRYVLDRSGLGRDRAVDGEYEFKMWEGGR